MDILRRQIRIGMRLVWMTLNRNSKSWNIFFFLFYKVNHLQMFQLMRIKAIIILNLLLIMLETQINIRVHPVQPTFTAANVFSADMNEDGSHVLAAIYESSQPIITRINATSGSSGVRIGDYKTGVSLASYYGYTFNHIIIDYLIASNINSAYPIVFNLTSYAKLGQFDMQFVAISMKYVQSKNIIIYGTDQGRIYYASMSSFPNPVSTLIHNINTVCRVYVEVSPDQTYFSAVYENNLMIVVFYMANFSIAYNVSTGCATNTHIWSLDSRYIAVFPNCNQNITFYDRNSSWTTTKILVNFTGIKFSFNYIQTNLLVMIPSTNNSILTMNWYDFSFTVISNLTLQGKYGKVSRGNSAFCVYMQNLYKAWFFKIDPYCQTGHIYDIPTKTCVLCPANCINCIAVTCARCISNYQLVNGSCQVCGPNTVYNTTTFVCDDIETLCSGDKYYSVSVAACVQCQLNCVDCLSTTQCQICAPNATLKSGVCELNAPIQNSSQSNSSQSNSSVCYQGEFLNSTTKQCFSCGFNCLSCISQKLCLACQVGDILEQGQCKTQNQKAFQDVIKNTMQNGVITSVNKVPGSRVLFSQALSLFVNMDSLWLYIYHKRQYGSIATFFKAVNNMMQEKWQFFDKDAFFQKLNIPFNKIQQNLNFKKNQTSWKFLEIQSQSSSFLENTMTFFLLNLPMVFLTYLIFRGIFLFSFKYRICAIFREYTLNLFFIYMLLDGNLQSFTYFIMYDFLQIRSLNIFEKNINFVMLILGFTFFLYVFAGLLIIYGIYGKNSRYFMKDLKINLRSVFFAVFQFSVLNFCFGACHILMENYYSLQMLILGLIEGFYICVLMLVLKSKNFYQKRYFVWEFVFQSFNRFLLIFLFSVDKKGDDNVRQVFDSAEMSLIMIYMFASMGIVGVEYLQLFYNLGKIVVKKFMGGDEDMPIKIRIKESEANLIVKEDLKTIQNKKEPRQKNRESVMPGSIGLELYLKDYYSKNLKVDQTVTVFDAHTHPNTRMSIINGEFKRFEHKQPAKNPNNPKDFKAKNLMRMKNHNMIKQKERMENEMKKRLNQLMVKSSVLQTLAPDRSDTKLESYLAPVSSSLGQHNKKISFRINHP